MRLRDAHDVSDTVSGPVSAFAHSHIFILRSGFLALSMYAAVDLGWKSSPEKTHASKCRFQLNERARGQCLEILSMTKGERKCVRKERTRSTLFES